MSTFRLHGARPGAAAAPAAPPPAAAVLPPPAAAPPAVLPPPVAPAPILVSGPLDDVTRNTLDFIGGYPRYDLPYNEARIIKTFFNQRYPEIPLAITAIPRGLPRPPAPPAPVAPRGPPRPPAPPVPRGLPRPAGPIGALVAARAALRPAARGPGI